MKYVVLSLALLIALSTPAVAQVHFGVQADASNFNFGNEALNNIYGLGVGGGAHMDFKLPLLGFRLSGDYLSLSPDKSKYQNYAAPIIGAAAASALTIDGGRIAIWSATLNVKLDILPLPVVHIYATGGGGYVHISSNDATVNFSGTTYPVKAPVENQGKASVNAGAGVDLGLGPVSLFGEVKIVWILTEGKTSTQVPLGTIGITF